MNLVLAQNAPRRRLRTTPPKVLYTYRAVNDHLRDALIKRQTWVSDPLSFNDPFDCDLPICKSSSPEKALASLSPMVAGMSSDVQAQVIREAKQGGVHCADEIAIRWRHQISTMGIACYCEEPNNILMWSHYAAKHEGVCLGFEKLQHRFDVQRVDYSNTLPTIELVDLLAPNDLSGIVKFFLTKSVAWSYEHEWRFLHAHPSFSGPDDPGRNIQFYPDELKRVIFGCRIKPERRKELLSLLKGWPTKIHFYDAVIHPSQFRLQIRAIKP